MAVVTRSFVGPLCLLLVAVAAPMCSSQAPDSKLRAGDAVKLRIVTFNIEDLRGDDLSDPSHARIRTAAAVLQRLRPDILLVNEIAYDQPGSPGWDTSRGEGMNGRRLAENFLAVSQAPDLQALDFEVFMVPVNTGIASGFDLDNNGVVVQEPPKLPPRNPDGSPGRQTAEGRAYGGDSWGFGTFPGQYASAVFVRRGLEVIVEEARTFRLFPWSRMPGAKRPVDPESGESWYSDEEWAALRLSSKTHWDLPVGLPNGGRLHLLVSHPTPPAFDGPEGRNKARNYDEIRLWADYLDGAEYLIDDGGREGGLGPSACFVILGDLNADPDEGDSLGDPVGTLLLQHRRVNGTFTPTADEEGRKAFPDLDADDTSSWGKRIDYVIPSLGLEVEGGGIWRRWEPDTIEPSDHFPVWLDLSVENCVAGRR